MAMGVNEHDFAGGIAFKYYDALYETELTGITWSVGKSGAITPVATFKPVIIDGTTVQNASMHNISIMKKLLGENPFIGQKVWIYKANMIIPQIAKAEK
jgi:DNA ligase (NAD+)